MSADKTKNLDYQPLAVSTKNGSAKSGDKTTLKPSQKLHQANFPAKNLINPNKKSEKISSEAVSGNKETTRAKTFKASTINTKPETEKSYAEQQKTKKEKKKVEKDRELLNYDRWLNRNGHSLTYVGIFLFTFVLYFRPYELFPALSGLSSIAFVVAIATLLIYLPTQLLSEGSLTIFSTEVKCILFLSTRQ